MLETAVQNVTNGIVIDDITACVKNVKGGRLKEEVRLDVYLRKDAEEEYSIYLGV